MDERNAEIVRLRKKGMTFVDIGRTFELSPARVSQIYNAFLHREEIRKRRKVEGYDHNERYDAIRSRLKKIEAEKQELLSELHELFVADSESFHSLKLLDLPVRVYTSLRRSGINSIEEVIEMSDLQLLSLRNFGIKALEVTRSRIVEFIGHANAQR